MHESVNELRSDNCCFYIKRTYIYNITGESYRGAASGCLSWRRCWLPIFLVFFIHIITSMFYHLHVLSVTCCGMSSRLIIKRRYTHTQSGESLVMLIGPSWEPNYCPIVHQIRGSLGKQDVCPNFALTAAKFLFSNSGNFRAKANPPKPRSCPKSPFGQ